jgi:hypothetical protein
MARVLQHESGKQPEDSGSRKNQTPGTPRKETAMKMTSVLTAVAAAPMLLAGPWVIAEDTAAKVQGEVVQVMQRVRTENAGALDALMIRTRQGENMRLLLGEPGSCPGCVQVGDRVRVRLAAGGPSDDGYRVQTMRIRRTGEAFRFRDGTGALVQTRSRNLERHRSGAAVQTRTRDGFQEPGAAGSGAARRGSHGAGNRGGRR